MPARRFALHRAIRWAGQLTCLTAFVVLFLRTRYGTSPALGDIFFRVDPLVFIIAGIAGRAIIATALLSLILVAATLVFGRFFCGFVCPLGTTIDLFDSVVGRKPVSGSRLRNGKFAVLFFLIVSALLGSSFLAFFDPLVIMERALALLFHPLGTGIADLLGDAVTVARTEYMAAFASLAALLGLGFFAPRFWCRNICPLGGLLGLLAKSSLFRFSFVSECRECGMCEAVCPTGAIDSARASIDPAECIDCLACRYRCAHQTIGYRAGFGPVHFDIGRREALMSVGSALVLAPLARNLLHMRLTRRLVRPPGALPEPDFLTSCIRCARCVKACPSGTLQPAVFEAGANGLWTPRAVGRVGGCEKNCNLCGQVCPTGAIRRLPLEEKSFARMGTAVVDRSRCIAWEQDRVCLVCDEACPYNAVNALSETIRGTALLRPFVDERVCVGCGICESRCPIEGQAAIQVFATGEERRRRGLYRTDAKVRQRQCGDEPVEDLPSGFIIDNR